MRVLCEGPTFNFSRYVFFAIAKLKVLFTLIIRGYQSYAGLTPSRTICVDEGMLSKHFLSDKTLNIKILTVFIFFHLDTFRCGCCGQTYFRSFVCSNSSRLFEVSLAFLTIVKHIYQKEVDFNLWPAWQWAKWLLGNMFNDYLESHLDPLCLFCLFDFELAHWETNN